MLRVPEDDLPCLPARGQHRRGCRGDAQVHRHFLSIPYVDYPSEMGLTMSAQMTMTPIAISTLATT